MQFNDEGGYQGKMKIVDARGTTCPKPVIMTKKAIDSGEKEVEVLVDNDVSFQNVRRFLDSQGYEIIEAVKKEDGTFVIRGKSEEAAEESTAEIEDTAKTKPNEEKKERRGVASVGYYRQAKRRIGRGVDEKLSRSSA